MSPHRRTTYATDRRNPPVFYLYYQVAGFGWLNQRVLSQVDPLPQWGRGKGEGDSESACSNIALNADLRPAHRIVGITNSAPARMPVGQRAVTVFSRV